MYTYPINLKQLTKEPYHGSTFNVNFELDNPQIISLSELFADGAIKSIQSIWIDNSNNNYVLNISISTSGQNITIPPHFQGVIPLVITSTLGGEITVSSSSSDAKIILILLDIPLNYFLYNTQGETTSVINTVNVDVINPTTSPVPVDLPANTTTAPLYVDVTNTSLNTNITNTTLSVDVTNATTTTPIPVNITNTTPYIDRTTGLLYNLPSPLPYAGNLGTANLTTAGTVAELSVLISGYYVYASSISINIPSNTTIATDGIVAIYIGWYNGTTFTSEAGYFIYFIFYIFFGIIIALVYFLYLV